MENRWNELTESEQREVYNMIESSENYTLHNPATNSDAFMYELSTGAIVYGEYQWEMNGTIEQGKFRRFSIASR